MVGGAEIPEVLASVADRFWAHVDFSGDCWLWTSRPVQGGYGQFKVQIGGVRYCVQAHRYSLWLTDLPPVVGEPVDHLCRNPPCVNPFHLEATTEQVNVLRGVGLAARQSRREACPRGHQYDYKSPDGRRRCSFCDSMGRKVRRRAA